MRKRLIYICSPLRGDIEKNIQKAQGYCREAVDLWPDVIPIAPHVYCTQFLDDTIPQEREAGMELGIALLDMCDELWVYGINNPSEGMKKEIAYAKEHGIPVKDAADLYRLREQEHDRERNHGRAGESGPDPLLQPQLCSAQTLRAQRHGRGGNLRA